MINANVRVPPPVNEPVLGYAPGSPERALLKETLKRMSSERIEIPLVIGGKQVRSGKTIEVRMPHKHAHVLALAHEAEPSHVEQAVAAARAARAEWSAMALHERAAIFLKAAELLATKYRPIINASTMLGQS
jgi:1-pyrroline-5-carboxylate dehydrogenase